ncbi:C-C motif chemokine 3-like [Hipposideros larvatus]
MKVLGATILVLLCTMALCSHKRGKTYTIPICCSSYVAQKISRKLVVRYFMNSAPCSKPGVIFLTKKGRLLCANPNDAWVQKYISNMENPQLDQWFSVPGTQNSGMSP